MDLRERRNTRLKNYDYSACGAYFVTVCADHRKEVLSMIRRGDPCGRPEVWLTELGVIAQKAFDIIENKYGVTIDCYAIMPDHIHFLVILPEKRLDSDRADLGRIIGAYKSLVATMWLEVCKSRGQIMGKIWQRNYFEHVIRNEQDLRETRTYIDGNPDRWAEKYNL